MKQINRHFLSILTIFISLLFFACNNIGIYYEEIELQNRQDMVCLSIFVQQNTSRTIMPEDITKSQIIKAELKAKLHNDTDFSENWIFNSIDELTNSTEISLPPAAYDFELNLYISRNNTLVLCQTASIKNINITGTSSTLNFQTQYVLGDTGNAQITLTWNKADRVTSIKAGLFTTESKGESAVEGYTLEELNISNTETECTACYSKSDIPSGNYFIRFELYAQDGTKLNTLEDIIYIAHYADTIKTIPLSNINTIYTVNYELGSSQLTQDISLVSNRNENKAILLPTDKDFEHSDSSLAFLGWYEDNDYSGEPVTAIQAGSKGDKTFYARWEEITTDNISEVLDYIQIGRTIKIKQGTTNADEIFSPIVNQLINRNIFEIGLDLTETNLTKIDNYAFRSYKSLKCILLPEGIISIGHEAFKGCLITEITIPESVTNIAQDAFAECNNLLTATINCNLPDYNSASASPFYNCKIQNLIFGSNVTSVGKNAFEDNSTVKTISFTGKIPTFYNHYNSFSGVNKINFNGSLLQYINNVGNFIQNLSSAYNLYINNSKITNLEIPEELTTLPYNVFNGCASITDITWNESITSIGPNAFYDCQNITTINLPEGITNIGYSCFAKCSNLTEVTLPETLTSIGDQAFSECTKLTQITLPESMTTLGNKCFENCEGLETITINCNLTDYANSSTSPFYNCLNIKNIIFGSNVTSIGQYNFYGLPSLKSFTFNESIPILNYYNTQSVDEVHFNGTLKYWMTNAKNIVKYFNSYNLYLNGEKFTYLNITDEDMTEIPDYAFYKCKSLQQFSIKTDKLETIGQYAFYGCTELYNIYLKEGIKTIDDYAFYGCTILNKDNRMNIPSTIENYGTHVFYGCTNLNDITVKCKLPEVTKMEDSAFYGAVIKSIDFEQDIPAYALYDQNSLEYVSLTSAVTKIGDYAFYNCQNLKPVSQNPESFLPIGVESIGEYAFKNCYSITTITLPKTIKSIGKLAFESCKNLETVNLKCDMPSFAKNTEAPFTGCTKFETLNIINTDGHTVKSIGNYAFYKANIKEIEFPSSVKQFHTSSFNSCKNLKTIILNSVPDQISSNAFYGVTGELKFTSETLFKNFNDTYYYEDLDINKVHYLKGTNYLGNNTWKIEETLGTVINFTLIRRLN